MIVPRVASEDGDWDHDHDEPSDQADSRLEEPLVALVARAEDRQDVLLSR